MPEDSSFQAYLRFLVTRLRGRQAAFLRYTIYLYLGSIFLFAALYFVLFLRNPATFAFAADVLSVQATTLKLQTRRDSVTAEQQIGLLQTLVDTLAHLPGRLALESRASPTERKAIFSVGAREYSVTQSVRDSAGAGAVESPGYLEVQGERAGGVSRIELPLGKLDVTPATTGELRDQAVGLIAFLREQLGRSHDLMMRLPTVVRPQWGYVDFVYFSAITQVTVGYGDILPNTTLVRILVILQSLVGVAMLVVVINLVLTEEPPRKWAGPGGRT